MSGFRSPLDAYREDLARVPGRKRLAAGDEFWIVLATGLRRLAQASPSSRPAAARRLAKAVVTLGQELDRKRTPKRMADMPTAPETGRPSAIAAALAQYPSAESASALVTHVRAAAADAEEAGAVILAREMLTDLSQLTSHAPALDRGGIFLQLGRISRTLGELDAAVDLLRAAGDVGRAEGIRELVVREALGEAVVARSRGNYPRSRALFESALEGARELGLVDVQGMSHQGLMIVAVSAGDLNAALAHAWQAFSAARAQGSRVAEVLGNLADLCAQAGYHEAAIGGFVASLARTSAPRVRLPVLAGLAKSAARLGDRKRLDDCERTIAQEANDAFPFETASAWLAVASARQLVGDAAASDAAAERAAVIAHAHGYFEITHRLEQAGPVTRLPLADSVMGVIRSLEAWTDDPSVELVLSSAPTG
jgi:tetratricopeptide (TPR) repeat protein